MIDWLQVAPALFAALGVLLLPGVLFGVLARLRGPVLLGVAVPVSVAFTAIASVVLPLVGARWSPLNAGVVLLVLSVGLGYLFRRFAQRRELDRALSHEPARTVLRDGVIVVAGGAVLAAMLAFAVGGPGNFDQAFDNVFHLNAIRFAMDEGSASPLTLGRLTNPDAATAFYPSGWHGINALVASLSGQSIAMANNAVLLGLCLTAWPLGLWLLARKVLGRGLEVAIAVAVFIPAFAAFPLHFLFFGPLFPMVLGIALLPAALALTLELASPSEDRTLNTAGTVVLLLGVLAGIAVAHPGVLLAWFVAADLTLLGWLLQRWRALTTARRLLVSASTLAFWAVSVVLLIKLQPSDQASHWGPNLSPLRAASDLVSGGIFRAPYALVVGLFIVIGLISLWVQRGRNPLNAHLMLWFAGFGFLYFVSEAQPHGRIRRYLIGAWYQDPNRLGMFALVIMCVVAVVGFVCVWRLAAGRLTGPGLIVALVLLGVVAASSWVGPNPRDKVQRVRPVFEVHESSGLVSDDELALLERLPEVVPEDAVVAGNPWQGAGMAYAFSNRQVLMPHMFVAKQADRDLILKELNAAEPGSAVCDAMERQRVEYVLDFPGPSVLGSGKKYDGLQGLASSPAVELADSEGPAKLYRIVGCG